MSQNSSTKLSCTGTKTDSITIHVPQHCVSAVLLRGCGKKCESEGGHVVGSLFRNAMISAHYDDE